MKRKAAYDETMQDEISQDSGTPSGSTPPQGDATASMPGPGALTRRHARDFREVLMKYVRRHLPRTTAAVAEVPAPPRVVGAHATLLPLLRLVPLGLVALFVVSMFWDFPGAQVSLLGYTLTLDGLLRILSVSGLIGFLTNWLAITMLFNPRDRRPIFGQGLIPAQRERVIYRLATAVSEELINADIIKQKIEESGIITHYREVALSVTRGVLEDPEFREDLKVLTTSYLEQVLGSESVRQRIAEFLIDKVEMYAGQGLGGLALKTYRFLNEQDFQRRVQEAVNQLPESLDTALDHLDRLLDEIPPRIEARSEDIEEAVTRVVLGFVENLDVYSMVASNMREYDERRLEDLLKKTTNEQLNYIKYLGGVLGVVGGLVIWEPPLALGVLGLLGGVLYLVDEFLFRLRRA